METDQDVKPWIYTYNLEPEQRTSDGCGHAGFAQPTDVTPATPAAAEQFHHGPEGEMFLNENGEHERVLDNPTGAAQAKLRLQRSAAPQPAPPAIDWRKYYQWKEPTQSNENRDVKPGSDDPIYLDGSN